MTSITIIPGDCRLSLVDLELDGTFVDTVFCDPPYHLESIARRFGKEGAAAPNFSTDGRFKRMSAGFIGRTWDGSLDGRRIAFEVETWQAAYRVLKPGGYLLAFGSPRTYHRMACAVEDAGFIIHPFIGWAYASGFPKAHSISAGIDKLLGVERPVIREGRKVRRMKPGAEQIESADWTKQDDGSEHVFRVTGPGSPEAAAAEGWYHSAQVLTPALEPILVAQKPYSERTAVANWMKHGVGGMNIDGCRSDGTVEDPSGGPPRRRWPKNLIVDDSPEVNFALGGNAGMFNIIPLAESLRLFPKAGKADRAGSEHPTVKPIALLRWLIRLSTPPGGLVLDPFAGSGTTAQAAFDEGHSSILMEAEPTYVEDIRRRVATILRDQDLLG